MKTKTMLSCEESSTTEAGNKTFPIVNIPLRRSRLSGKMETTCPDRRKPL